MSGLPKNWPDSVRYLKENIVDKSVSPPTLKLECKDARSLMCPRVDGVCKIVAIKKIDSIGHPARGQSGLFALKDITPRTYVLDYKGLVTANCSVTSDYVLSFDGNLSIDAENNGNEARHINDFRGVSKRPNAEFDNYFDKDGVLHMGVFSLYERIPKGQEILVSYGKGFWQARGLLPSYTADYGGHSYSEYDELDAAPAGGSAEDSEPAAAAAATAAAAARPADMGSLQITDSPPPT
jgi:hypothetical protein